jgi:hypothetical protein
MPIEVLNKVEAGKRSRTKYRRKEGKRLSLLGSVREQAAMNWVALQMLTGDRAKYLGLIFTIAFSSFLIAQQLCIFSSIMDRTRSQIIDVRDADIWVMDPATQYFDEVYALKDSDVDRVRGVPGVRWAVRLFKGQPRAKAPDMDDSESPFCLV